MAYRLSDVARAEGHRLHAHDRLASTNTEALERARSGETGTLWVVAARQDAGRGRRGNHWTSLPGNLTASLLWPVAGVAPERVATLGFVAGLALVQALGDLLGAVPVAGQGPRFRLKWPNDVLAGEAKLAGILLESESLPGGRRALVVGFGVNVVAAPAGLAYPAVALADLGVPATAEALFEHLTGRLVEAGRIWNQGRNFPAIRERWLRFAAGLGEAVAVRLDGETLRGRFDTIDEGGRLVILAPDGARRTVTAGEVHFGTAATAA